VFLNQLPVAEIRQKRQSQTPGNLIQDLHAGVCVFEWIRPDILQQVVEFFTCEF